MVEIYTGVNILMGFNSSPIQSKKEMGEYRSDAKVYNARATVPNAPSASARPDLTLIEIAPLPEGDGEGVVDPEGDPVVVAVRFARSRKAAKLFGPDSTALIANTMPCPQWPV